MMDLDLKTVFAFCGGMLGIFAFIGQLKNFFSSGEKELGKSIADLKLLVSEGHSEIRQQLASQGTKLIEHDRRIQALESDMKHIPNRDTMHNLEISFAKLSGQVELLNERMAPIAATTRRLQEFLIEKATQE